MSKRFNRRYSRRQFVQISTALAVTGTAPLVTGCDRLHSSSPLGDRELKTLAAIAETFVPGAVDAHVDIFMMAMLSRDDPLLTYRFTPFPISAVEFYKAAITAIDSLSRHMRRKAFRDLSPKDRLSVINALKQPEPDGWQGPPSNLVYFVLRNDAIDAVYGTPAGYDRLGIPYFAHIDPPKGWPP